MLYSEVQNLIANGVDWNQIIYINFEDERLSEFTLDDFNDILLVKNMLTDRKAYFFFDVIQNIDGWEKFARRLADEKDYVRITGSNAKMLSREISGTLGGRYIPQYVSTYSFAEFLKAKDFELSEDVWNKTAKRGKLIRLFDEYYTYGGYPEAVDLNDKRGYVSNVYQKVILGDVAARNEIRNETALRLLVKKIAESVKNEISFTKLYNSLKSIGVSISKDTVIEYMSKIFKVGLDNISTLTASKQIIDGDVLVDNVSNLNLILNDGSEFTGAINSDGEEGEVYVELNSGSTWTLTADTYITSLSCEKGAIDLNGHSLYINGVLYDGGASEGEAIEAVITSGGGPGGPGEDGPGNGGPGDPPPEKP